MEGYYASDEYTRFRAQFGVGGAPRGVSPVRGRTTPPPNAYDPFRAAELPPRPVSPVSPVRGRGSSPVRPVGPGGGTPGGGARPLTPAPVRRERVAPPVRGLSPAIYRPGHIGAGDSSDAGWRAILAMIDSGEIHATHGQVRDAPPGLRAETALRFTWLRERNTWQKEVFVAAFYDGPIERKYMGAMRGALPMHDLSQTDARPLLAKRFLEVGEAGVDRAGKPKPPETEPPRQHFLDVQMQAVAVFHAAEFNRYHVPKPVAYVDAAVVVRPGVRDRNGDPMCYSAERALSGQYEKWTTNTGWVLNDHKNTPLAFSHFTYCRSGGKLIVVDIQGVEVVPRPEDPTAPCFYFTDPQVHTTERADLHSFGRGNLGKDGVRQFFATHRCNAICRFIGLPPNNPLGEDLGTVRAPPPHSFE